MGPNPAFSMQKVHVLEKITPSRVVAVVTNMSYASQEQYTPTHSPDYQTFLFIFFFHTPQSNNLQFTIT